MSHFTTVKTRLVCQEALVAALKKLGFSMVEVHDGAQPLYGYQGDRRTQAAEVIVRRQYVGYSSNDIGFKQLDDGTFEAIISAYDRHFYNQEWLQSLQVEHDKAYVQIQYPPHLWDYSEVTAPNGTVQLTLTKKVDLYADTVGVGGW